MKPIKALILISDYSYLLGEVKDDKVKKYITSYLESLSIEYKYLKYKKEKKFIKKLFKDNSVKLPN